jgi:hypothetical protein
MNIQAKVALDKEKHPEKYCPAPRCLFVITKWKDFVGEERVPREDCPNGRCPRHQ